MCNASKKFHFAPYLVILPPPIFCTAQPKVSIIEQLIGFYGRKNSIFKLYLIIERK